MIVFYGALTVLDGLLLLVLATSRVRWWIGAGAILLAMVVNATLLVSALPDKDGAATGRDIPEPNTFVSCAVDESTAIYFWLIVGDAPKGYRQPYSRELHRTCVQARQQAQAGLPVTIGKSYAQATGSDAHNPGRYVPYLLPPSLGLKSGS